jgi:hypothetical protein
MEENMKTSIRRRLLVPTIVMVAAAGTMAQSGDEPIGPPKPVVVVNTPANPVPVTGTVTGNVSISGNVNVTNSPTVKIDSTANTVKVDGGTTDVLLYLNDHDFSADLLTGIGPIDVSKYKQVRVSFVLLGSSEGDLGFHVGSVLPDGGFLGLLEDDVTLDPGHRYSRVFDVPGKNIKILFGATPGKRIGRLAIFGR